MRKIVPTALLGSLGALLIAVSTAQIASANERHPVRRAPRAATTDQFRNANNAVIVLPADPPASVYSGGWSAPAGR